MQAVDGEIATACLGGRSALAGDNRYLVVTPRTLVCASVQERRLNPPSKMRRRTTATTPRPTVSSVTTPTNKSANTTRGAPPSRSP